MQEVLKIAMWGALLFGTPYAMSQMDIDMSKICKMDSETIGKQLDSMNVDDPIIRAQVQKTLGLNMSGDCREVLANALKMIKENQQNHSTSLSTTEN